MGKRRAHRPVHLRGDPDGLLEERPEDNLAPVSLLPLLRRGAQPGAAVSERTCQSDSATRQGEGK